MIHQVFTVYDHASEAWMQPFFAPTKKHGLRSFVHAVNSKGHDFNRFAKDYTLFHLGEWDDGTAAWNINLSPEAINTALEVKETENEPLTLPFEKDQKDN